MLTLRCVGGDINYLLFGHLCRYFFRVVYYWFLWLATGWLIVSLQVCWVDYEEEDHETHILVRWLDERNWRARWLGRKEKGLVYDSDVYFVYSRYNKFILSLLYWFRCSISLLLTAINNVVPLIFAFPMSFWEIVIRSFGLQCSLWSLLVLLCL